MTYLWIIIIVFAIWAFMRWGSKPQMHKNIPQNNLVYSIKELYYRGYNGGHIMIQVPTDDKKFKRFVQLSKYIEGKGKVGVLFAYPLAEWSKFYYSQLKELLKEKNVKYKIEDSGNEMVTECITIDFKKDVEKAAEICQLVFQMLYGLSPDDCVELYYVNVAAGDTWVGFD